MKFPTKDLIEHPNFILGIVFSADELAVGNYFTSLNDSDEADMYYWESTGQPLGSYSNWYDKNPELGVADCSLIAAGDINSPVNGKWQSINCKFIFAFICEGAIV